MGDWLKNMNDWLKKYLTVFGASWQNSFVYRLNFIVWRLRAIILRLAAYFFWYAVYRFNKQIVGYDERMMLTYVLASSILHSLVLGSRSVDVSGEISTGVLSNYLLKPVNYFSYWLSRDLADKLLNLIFVIFELGLIILILRPPLFIQTNIFYLFSFMAISILSIFIYFYLSLIISLTTFWYPEHNGWPAKFLFMVSLRFLSGGLLPLDILPRIIFSFLRFLPTAYFIFFPLQIYLGRVSPKEIFIGFMVMIFWIFSLRFLVNLIWQKGLRSYTSVGI